MFYLLQIAIFVTVVWNGTRDGIDPGGMAIVGGVLAYMCTFLVVLALEVIASLRARWANRQAHGRPTAARALTGDGRQTGGYAESALGSSRLLGERAGG
ncbi:MAG: hypothetical protein ACJ8DU_15590 [Microvirga sp.]|jgi:hypothetical protein